MLRIHSSLDDLEIHNLKNALESNGIACEVRGAFLRSVMGEVPISESFIELWIQDGAQEAAAREILAETLPSTSASWDCPKCGESVEGTFDQCWSCQAARREV